MALRVLKKNQAFETCVAAKAHRFCCTAQKSRLMTVPSFYSLFARLEYLVFQEDEGNMQEVRVFRILMPFKAIRTLGCHWIMPLLSPRHSPVDSPRLGNIVKDRWENPCLLR